MNLEKDIRMNLKNNNIDEINNKLDDLINFKNTLEQTNSKKNKK